MTESRSQLFLEPFLQLPIFVMNCFYPQGGHLSTKLSYLQSKKKHVGMMIANKAKNMTINKRLL